MFARGQLDLSTALISIGFARVDPSYDLLTASDPTWHDYFEQLKRIEQKARNRRDGIWNDMYDIMRVVNKIIIFFFNFNS